MPAMPRASKKLEKIAFRILGTPPNMRKERLKREQRNKRLKYSGLRLVK